MDDLVVVTAPRIVEVEDAYTPLEYCFIDHAYDSVSYTWPASTGVERHDEEQAGASPKP